MIVNLCIPRPPVEVQGATINQRIMVYRFPLRWTTDHTQSHYGLGVLLDPQENIFDGYAFRSLRDSAGVWIESDTPERVAHALGVPTDEPGIVQLTDSVIVTR